MILATLRFLVYTIFYMVCIPFQGAMYFIWFVFLFKELRMVVFKSMLDPNEYTCMARHPYQN